MLEKLENIDEIIDLVNNIDVIIVDENGYIIKMQSNFEEMYGCKSEYVLGRTVKELEEEGIFYPSVTEKVLKTGEEVTIIQTAKNGNKLISIGVPIKNSKNQIIRVVNYTTNIGPYLNLKKWSDELYNKIDYYKLKINEIEKIKNEIGNITVSDFQLKKEKPIKDDLQENIMSDLVSKNKNIEKIIDLIKKISKYEVNILLLGETGVGKTKLAQKIHLLSNRQGKFIDVNCGAVPNELIESELFGYERGAFTGAKNEGKKGLIEEANKGTIFLDEICELPIHTQVKLLKVLQDKEIRKIGSNSNQKIDFKIIAATNKNIEQEVEQGRFRRDLFYRLNTITIEVPSLRQRREDIVLIADYFLQIYNKKFGQNKVISSRVLDIFRKYSWPGNIRELENLIQRLILTCEDDLIHERLLPETMKKNKLDKTKIHYLEEDIIDLNKAIEDFESEIINRYYNKYKSSIKVAEALNISQSTSSRKIKKYVKSEDISD